MNRALAILLLAGLAAAASAQDDGRTLEPARFAAFLGTQDFAIYEGDAKTGWYRITLAPDVEWEGRRVYAKTHVSATLGEVRSTWKETKYFLAAFPYEMVGFEVERTDGSGTTRTTGRVEDGAMLVTRETPDGAEATRGEPTRHTLVDYVLLQTLCREGIDGPELRRRIQGYSTDALADYPVELVIHPMRGVFDQGVTHTIYRTEAIQPGGGGKVYTYLNDLGEIVDVRGEGGFSMRPEPAEWARSDRSHRRALCRFDGVVTGDLPPGARIDRLLVHVLEAQGPPPEGAARQSTLALDEGNWIVSLAQAELEDEGSPGDASDSAFLAAEPEVPVDDAEVRAIAREVAARADDPRRRVALLLAWLDANVRPVRRPLPVPARSVLTERAGDGPGRTALFAALARASGIPTRRVHGLVLREGRLTYSEWAEVHVGDWRPVDPGSGSASIGGGHLRLGPLIDGVSRASEDLATARFALLPLAGAAGDVIVLTDGRAFAGRRTGTPGDRVRFRLEHGEVSWPASAVRRVAEATPAELAASRQILEGGAYRNNVHGFSTSLPGDGWTAEMPPGATGADGLLLVLRSGAGDLLVSLLVQHTDAPLDLGLDEFEAAILRQGGTAIDEPEWFVSGDLHLQRRRFRLGGQGPTPSRRLALLAFERGRAKFQLAASAPSEDDLTRAEAVVERLLESLRFDR